MVEKLATKEKPTTGNAASNGSGFKPADPANVVASSHDRKPRRKVADPNETKADKFKRLANFRVPKAVRVIRQLSALANRSTYEYTPEQSAKVIQLMQDELAALRNRFTQAAPDEVKSIF